ncbi:MAG: pyrroline-5-carboxylate reductase [Candidatus Tyrphobacter sp.]
MNVGILGLGTLGRTLALGLHGHADVAGIAATVRVPRDAPQGIPGITMMRSNAELARWSDVLFICVKPFQVEDLLREIEPELRESLLLVSTAASVRIEQLTSWAQWRAPIVRAMPNMPCRIGAGMTVLAAGTDVSEAELLIVTSLFERLGRVTVIEERLMDAATGLSACGPAYVYLIVEAMSEAGVKLGLSRKLATLLAAQTLFGSAQLVLESNLHPAALKDEVTTPAGCTVDGLMVLEEGKLRSTLLNAVIAAATRSAQFSIPSSEARSDV